MSAINDGGPAFPSESYDAEVDMDTIKPGMSLRDWFAGQALAGQLAFSPHDSFEKLHKPDEVAERMYAFADAMLAARSNKEG